VDPAADDAGAESADEDVVTPRGVAAALIMATPPGATPVQARPPPPGDAAPRALAWQPCCVACSRVAASLCRCRPAR
jgi:hypothetical protein